jgi:hypothetical protein
VEDNKEIETIMVIMQQVVRDVTFTPIEIKEDMETITIGTIIIEIMYIDKDI